MKKVRKELGLENDENKIINCLIIYPNLENNETDFRLDEIAKSFKKETNQIKAYHKVYKLGIPLPLI